MTTDVLVEIENEVPPAPSERKWEESDWFHQWLELNRERVSEEERN